MNYHYENADTSFVVNEDPDLKPIRISLPPPPLYELIDGFGKKPNTQRFERITIPYKLKALEQKIKDSYKKDGGGSSHKKFEAITNFKLQKEFWETIDNEREYYQDEIAFIKKVWWHKLNGYWFFNNGKPTYITGWHYSYLNFWHMPDVKGGYPDYRDRDRKEFLFHHYIWTCTETFKHVDKDGIAEKRNGKYEMIDTGKRIMFGIVQSKNRRSGATNRGLCFCHEILITTLGTDGMGIMSYTEDNSSEHFNMKLIPAWREMPIWMKPYTKSKNTPSSIEYDVPSNEFDLSGLKTKATYAETSSSTFYDGKKLISSICDEEGKSKFDVFERWRVIKNCHSQGNGSIIHGYSYHPSTVEEYEKGGKQYYELTEASNFYKRLPSGQTESGMARLFVNATEGLDGHIDSYGYSIVGEPTVHQKKEGFKQGALDYLQSKRDYLLRHDTPESQMEYRSERKLFPLRYSDSWLGEAGEVGFDISTIDKALEIGRRTKWRDTIVGNFEWEIKNKKVIWVHDPQNGRWEIHKDHLYKNLANLYSVRRMYNSILGRMVDYKEPTYPDRITIGADPFKFKTEAEFKRSMANRDKMSKGGITIFLNHDETVDPIDKPRSEWETELVIGVYKHRHASDDDFADDVLKTSVWFGGMVYPEMNVEIVEKWFVNNGFEKYLKYGLDNKGRLNKRPGSFIRGDQKQQNFGLARNFIAYRGHTIVFKSLLEELKNIKSIEDLTDNDLTASFMMALDGAQSAYSKVIKRRKGMKLDISEIRNFRQRI